MSFQSPPSELLVPEKPFLPKLPDNAPLPQGELLVAVAEDSAAYRRVVEKLTALQLWIAKELRRIQGEDVAAPGDLGFVASVTKTSR